MKKDRWYSSTDCHPVPKCLSIYVNAISLWEKKMIKKVMKRGRGRPRKEDANTTVVSVALSASDVEDLESVVEEGETRSEVARELIREGIHNRITPEDAARRKRERIKMMAQAFDSLGYTGTVREAAIAKLLADKAITPEMAAELAKRKRK
jgi:Arc/MetJ-type ribon-helix-helix transcriptional regulator